MTCWKGEEWAQLQRRIPGSLTTTNALLVGTDLKIIRILRYLLSSVAHSKTLLIILPRYQTIHLLLSNFPKNTSVPVQRSHSTTALDSHLRARLLLSHGKRSEGNLRYDDRSSSSSAMPDRYRKLMKTPEDLVSKGFLSFSCENIIYTWKESKFLFLPFFSF